MKTVTEQLADALRVVAAGNTDYEDLQEIARNALAAYDAQPKQWTVFIRDECNTGTTYITCVEAEDVEAAKAAASALCREDWQYEESEPLHILGVIERDIGNVVEWDDAE